jgi:DNA-binding transcriptional MerR regulator
MIAAKETQLQRWQTKEAIRYYQTIVLQKPEVRVNNKTHNEEDSDETADPNDSKPIQRDATAQR